MSDHDGGPDFDVVLASTLHDVKNSIALLVSAIDQLGLRVERELPELAPDLYGIQAEARRMNNELVQLLSLYRMGRGEFSVSPRDVVVVELLEEALSELESVLRTRGVAVEIDCDPELSWVLDDNLVLGVIRNALNNMARYARDRVRISARTEGGWLVIGVEDNGAGYPESVLRMAGGPARDVDFRSASTGLGIYFAREVMGRHSRQGRVGRIELANGGSLGGGVFTLYLP